MVKHIWKMIWNQRSSNGWIFMELLLVFGALWVMMDSMLVSWYIYRQPLGFDIANVYKINIGKKSAGIPGYQPDSLLATSEGEDLIRLVENIRRAEEVDEICVASSSCPYTWSNSWSQLVRADADTSVKANYFQYFEVTPSYFDVLRIKDREGYPLRPIVEKNVGDLAVTSDFEKELFEGESCIGKQVKWSINGTETMSERVQGEYPLLLWVDAHRRRGGRDGLLEESRKHGLLGSHEGRLQGRRDGCLLG